MANIADLPDTPQYTIKVVAIQTGIRPVTLRAWERRHEVLNPQRADNHYRLYSERDVAILRWLKSRVDAGISISTAVAELRSMMAQGLMPEVSPVSPQKAKPQPTHTKEEYIKFLYQAFLAHDEIRSYETFKQAAEEYDLIPLFTEILVPVLTQIGEDWYLGKITIATEHFASNFLRGRLLDLFQTYPIRKNSSYVLIGCAPFEQHELGSLMLATLLRAHGYRVEYLGPDVPIDDLVDFASYEHPAMIILSASSSASAIELKNTQQKLAKLRRPPLFGYGGRGFDNHPEIRQKVAGIYLGNTLEKALEKVNELLGEHSSKPYARKGV
ncbi:MULTISPECIES: MerR family transcriptional regulator [Anaerolinea]|uniref:MerR family transcriptional regulator n=1 Tax=Anaerolinea thermophila (strain DSM 14523 / JCM 11388 / NBRC 100420 / UNI-1) TaxID=926569 RepID=E8N4L9_ANATU|nr:MULTISPECIES: cobalamin-dependent protein [Anaerolinea]BAJ63383.1 MerR family transcriptional regulator [Anaerolinea thermophila UNI-1]